jgi:transcriptional regulator with XRE-family HTH domain
MDATARITSLDLRTFRRSRESRSGRPLTQAQVAAAMGCARITVMRIEQRRTLPRPETARRFVEAVIRAAADAQ